MKQIRTACAYFKSVPGDVYNEGIWWLVYAIAVGLLPLWCTFLFFQIRQDWRESLTLYSFFNSGEFAIAAAGQLAGIVYVITKKRRWKFPYSRFFLTGSGILLVWSILLWAGLAVPISPGEPQVTQWFVILSSVALFALSLSLSFLVAVTDQHLMILDPAQLRGSLQETFEEDFDATSTESGG